MKLEFEVIPQNSFNNYQTSSPAGVEEMLQSGIKHAKDGNRAEARRLLQSVTEISPENETAWMWLASISEYPEELLSFLQNVLKINPNNQRAVDWIEATRLLLAKTFVERGVAASQENRKDAANRYFSQALTYDEKNELAWLSLASNADSAEKKAEYLQKVLSINPENEAALASLKSVRHEVSEQLLKQANFAAISGERETARKFLEEAMQDAPELEEAWILKAYLADDSEEKIACYEKILSLNPDNEAAQAGLASLKMLLQKNSEPKFNIETVNEMLENHYITESVESQPEKTSDSYNNNLEFDASGKESHEFTSDSLNSFHFSEDSSEIPTDELREDFVEEIKSQGGFSDVKEFGSFSTVEDHSDIKDSNLADTENQVFNDFNSTEASDESRPTEEFQVSEDSSPVMFSEAEQSDDIFEIEVSEDDNLSNIFSMENNVEEPNSQNENLFFESSDENVLSEVDSNFSLETDSDFPVEFSGVEDLPTVEETPAASAISDSYEFTKSEPSPEQNPIIENSPFESQEFTQTPNRTETYRETSENSFVVDSSQLNESESETHTSHAPNDSFTCPFCFVTNEPQAFICNSCRTMFSLSDMEMLLSHNEAQPQVLEMLIEDLENEKSSRQLTGQELKHLGIAYLNMKNLRKALTCLQEASLLNENDVVLASKVNTLAIRVSEIEEHEIRAEGTPVKNLTVMVVDDSATVRKLISSKLEKCGHTVVTAADGEEALSQLNDVKPDLILLDIMMPNLDGYQVCKMIRNNEHTKDVPVIMISGKDGFFDKVRGRMAGTTGYITKPFGPETLMRTIETYVG